MGRVFITVVYTLFFFLLCSCTDLSGIEADIEKTSIRVSKLEDALILFKKAYEEGKSVSKVERMPSGNGWKMTFGDNSSIVLLDATNNESLIASISREVDKGVVVLTMKDGTEFRFDIDVSFPMGVIALSDTIFISPNGKATLSVIINPSNAYINTNLKDINCSISISEVNSNRSSNLENIALKEIALGKDVNGNVTEGVYSITLADLGQCVGYTQNIRINLHSKGKNGESTVVSSSVITVISQDLFQDFSIGGMRGEIKNGLVFIQLPEDVNIKKLKPTFTSNGKVYVNGVEQVSGVSEQDFSSPVQYKAVANDGTEKKYYVCVTNGQLTLININSPVPNISSFQNNTTIEVYHASSSHTYKNVKIKGYDNLSWELDKKSYEIVLEKSEEFLGLKSNTSFVFFANHSDKTLLRNDLAFRMNRDLFTNISWVPSSLFANVILNGEFIGCYLVAETVKLDKNRINVQDIVQCPNSSLVDNYGYLLEVNDRKDGALTFVTSHGINFSVIPSGNSELSNDYKNHIKNHIQDCENVLYSSGFIKNQKYFDVNSFVDWFLINEIAKNCNSNFHINCFMYFNPSDQKIHMGPIWDCTIAYGNINFIETELYYDWWLTKNKWYSHIIEDPEFKKKVKNRWNETKYELNRWVSTKIQERATEIKGTTSANFEVWPILGKYVWPNPKGFEKRISYQSEVDYLKEWIANRIEWIDSEIRGW